MMERLFDLGRLWVTPGAKAAVSQEAIAVMLKRHASGDFGALDEEDLAVNRDAVKHGQRVLSAYAIDAAKPCKGFGANCIWVITERDRSVTTILLPDEY